MDIAEAGVEVGKVACRMVGIQKVRNKKRVNEERSASSVCTGLLAQHSNLAVVT